MAPLTLSSSWYRRFFVAIGCAALVYGGLYSTLTAITKPLFNGGGFDLIALIGATLSLAAAVGGFVITKKTNTAPKGIALLAFIVFAFTTAYSVQQSGGVASPFLAFWALVVLFSAVFGAYGWVLTIVLTGTYTAAAYLNGDLTVSTIVTITLSSVIPLVIGLFLFRDHAEPEKNPSGTNVKHLASQLSEVAAKSEVIINAIGDGVIAVDAKGTIQLINPAAQEILGWGKQDALLLHYKSVLRLTDEQNNPIDDAADPVQEVLNTNQLTHGSKLMALTKAEQKVAVSITVSPIDASGSGVIIIFRDVTKERAEEREQAEFISTASHEMRTPVASIEGYLGLAVNPATATIDQRAYDFIKKAQDSAQHLGRLFQDLLDVSKAEDGRMTNVPKVTDLVPFVQTLCEGLNQKAVDKGLRLVFNPGQSSAQRKLMPVYYVNQDPSHMREIIDNLIENAIKYTPEGEVTVDIAGSEDRVVVSVKDTGLGIPAEDLPHLFQKFYRIDNKDRQEIGGTGLGLYLSRRLAESLNGRIWAESVFTQGSTFFLELPRISTQEAESLKRLEATQTPAAPTSIPVKTPEEVAPTPTPAPVPAPAQPQQPTAPTPVAAPVAPPAPAPQPVAPPAPVVTQPATPPVAATPTPAPVPSITAAAVRPATTVPRGESLTRDQIAERVRQLEALAQQERQQSIGR